MTQPTQSLWRLHPWLSEMLIAQWERGLSTRRIAAMMQAELTMRGIRDEINKDMVIGKAHRLGLSRKVVVGAKKHGARLPAVSGI